MTRAVRREKVACVRASSVSVMIWDRAKGEGERGTPSYPQILLASACHLEKEKVITMVMVTNFRQLEVLFYSAIGHLVTELRVVVIFHIVTGL